jgi:hypothetical protein
MPDINDSPGKLKEQQSRKGSTDKNLMLDERKPKLRLILPYSLLSL